MKKERKNFVVSELFPIFAPAIIEKSSDNAHFDILHDRQKRADLIESGKFIGCVCSLQRVALESSPACPVSLSKDTDCFTIFVLRVITRTLSGEYVRKACPSLLVEEM